MAIRPAQGEESRNLRVGRLASSIGTVLLIFGVSCLVEAYAELDQECETLAELARAHPVMREDVPDAP